MNTHRRRQGGRLRRGSALILVLLMTLAVAALAVAAIFMTSSAGLVARFYDKERVVAYAAESGLQMALATMRSSSNFVIADDDALTTLLSGVPVLDADGQAIPGASVWVYAMRTGDVSAAGEKTITLIARAYDSFGTRQVRRMDVRQESITKYALFFNDFPSGSEFGPTVLSGRVHSNGNLVNDAKTQFLDSVTVVGTNTGGAFTTGLKTSAERVPFPLNDQLTGLATQAAGDNLSITPITAGRPGRLEFVTLPAAGDTMAFVRYFELASGQPSTLLRVKPSATWSTMGSSFHSLTDRIVQNQCGAFYYRNSQWQFFPVATHRATWAQNIIKLSGYPTPISGWDYRGSNTSNANAAVIAILKLPTSRCFPAGSPFLMPTERFTDANGRIQGTSSLNTFPWGTATSFPSSPQLTGGTATTFTRRPRTCTINNATDSTAGRCSSTAVDLGSWLDRPSGYTAVSGAAQPSDTAVGPAHWPIDARRNTAFEGVVNVSRGVNDTTFVSGVVRGNVTLRVAGTVGLIDHLVYESDPNDPTKSPCTDMLGLIATKDIVVVNGAMTSVRRYGTGSASIIAHLGAGPFYTLHGYLLSTGGTVGVEAYQSSDQMVNGTPGTVTCIAPPDATPQPSSGGCFIHVGSAAMATYRKYKEGPTASQTAGFLPFPIADRCQSTGRQPPGFPAVSGFRVIRTLEVDASRANTEPKILAFLRSLRGTNLD